MASSSGITPDEQRGLWYYWALRSCGEKVLVAVLRSAYRGGSVEIKDYVAVVLRNKSMGVTEDNKEQLYKKWCIDEELRKKINGGWSFNDFDINSLHKLLRINDLCDLPSDIRIWKDEKNKLEHGIQFLKDERNTLSHQKLVTSETEFLERMDRLTVLLKDLLQEAENRFPANSSANFGQLSTIICNDIKNIQETYIIENMDPAKNEHYQKLQEIKKLFRKHEEKDVWDDIMQRTSSEYSQLCCVVLGDELYVEPHRVFVPVELEQDDAVHTKGKRTIITHDQLVTVKKPDGTDPTVVVLKGNIGMGKTTIMKAITHHWINKTTEFDGLSSFHFVLFTYSRDTNKRCLSDLLKHRLSKTVRLVSDCDRLKEIVLSKPLMIIIDGYEEGSDAYKNLLKEILALPGHCIKVFITTRHEDPTDLMTIVPENRRTTLRVLGIDERQERPFITQLLRVFSEERRRHGEGPLFVENQEADITQEITKKTDELTDLLQGMGESVRNVLHRPLNLYMLVRFWDTTSEEVSSLTSVTTLFEACRVLIRGSVIDKLLWRDYKESKAEALCDEFLSHYDELLRGVDLEREIGELRRKVSDMNVPDDVKEEFQSFFLLLCDESSWERYKIS